MIALDTLLLDEILWAPLLIVLLKVVVVFVVGLLATMLMVWFERKAIAGMQNRIGPNKTGPFGIMQTLADGIKLFFKEVFPIDVLWHPTVLDCKEPLPIAVLLFPVVLTRKAH